MKFSVLPTNKVILTWKLTSWMIMRRASLLLFGILVSTTFLQAQQSGDGTVPDKQTLQLLLQRIAELEANAKKIDQLEAKVRQLEAGNQQAAATSAAPVPAQTSEPHANETEQQPENAEPERMDLSKTLLRMRGFGDITLHGDSQKGDTTSFSLGQLNLFVTSDISEKFKFLSEIIFEGGPDNIFGVTRGENNAFSVDVERYLVQYSYNDYFKLAAGRWHTAIGYYNTAYHHSTWFQTTTGLPT